MIRANELLAGQYRAKRLLGRGGGGKVWDAVDEATGQPVAVKELHSAEGFSAADLLRLKREATLLFQLRDPGIVRLYHLVLPGPDQPHAFFVMEKVAGETLRARLDRVGTMSVEAETASCVVDVLSDDRGPESAGAGRFLLQVDLHPVDP